MDLEITSMDQDSSDQSRSDSDNMSIELFDLEDAIENLKNCSLNYVNVVEPTSCKNPVKVINIQPKAVVIRSYCCDLKVLKDKSPLFREVIITGEAVRSKYNAAMKNIYVEDVDVTDRKGDGTLKSFNLQFQPLKYVLEHMHGKTSRNLWSNDEALAALEIAIFFGYQAMIDNCSQYFLKDSSLDNSVELMQNRLILHEEVAVVYQAAFRVCLWNFKQIAARGCFVDFPLEVIKSLLKHDKLNVDNEDQVLSALRLWHDGNSSEDLSELISECVRKELEPNRINKLHEKCNIRVNNSLYQYTNSSPRLRSETVIVFGGEVRNKQVREGAKKVSYYNSTTKQFEKLTDLPSKNGASLLGFAATVDGTRVWISGGSYNFSDDWNRKLYCYDTLTDVWSDREYEEEPRRHHGACSDGKHLFMIGGFGKYRERKSTVLVILLDSFLVGRSKPLQIANLPTVATSPACFVADACIFVLTDRSMYRYDLQTQQWSGFQPTCLGPHDTFTAATPLFFNSVRTGVVEVSVRCEKLNKKKAKVQVQNVSDWRQNFVFRWYRNSSEIVSLGGEVYRVIGRLGDEYRVNLYKRASVQDQEEFLCGEHQFLNSETSKSHCSIIAPVLRDAV